MAGILCKHCRYYNVKATIGCHTFDDEYVVGQCLQTATADVVHVFVLLHNNYYQVCTVEVASIILYKQ